MSIVVIDTSDLEKLIRCAVRAELDARVSAAAAEWIAMKATRLPRASLVKAIEAGHVRSAKVGRAIHVHAGDVQAWLEKKAAEPKAPSVELAEPTDEFEAARARAKTRRAS